MSLTIGKLGSFHCERQSDAPLVVFFPTDGFEKFSCIQRCGSIFVPPGTCHWICLDFKVQAETPSISFIELNSAKAVKPFYYGQYKYIRNVVKQQLGSTHNSSRSNYFEQIDHR